MQLDDYILIDKYLQGDLTQDAVQNFELRLVDDPAFAEALAQRMEINRYLKAKKQLPSLEAKMEKLGGKYFRTSKHKKEATVKPLWRRKPVVVLLSAAAAILLLLFVWNPFQNDSLYEQYAKHPSLAMIERNSNSETSVLAQKAYNDRDFEQAYIALKKLTINETDNTQANLALGIAALETGRTAEAFSLFNGIESGDSVYKEYGRWYLALTYLKAGHEDHARQSLAGFTPSDPILKRQVEAFLKEETEE